MKTLFGFLLLVAFILPIHSCGNADSPQRAAQQASVASSAQFTSGNSAYRIPFRIVDQLLVVWVTVNDSLRLQMIFDTGFGTEGALLFDSEMGVRLGLKYVSQIELGGGGGKSNRIAHVATGASLSLPGAKFVNQPLLVMAQKQAFKDWPVDGVIGKTLCNCVVEIDYEDSVLNLYDGIVTKPENPGQEFKVTFSYGIPVIDAITIIETGQPMGLKLLLDTGFSFPLGLFTYSDERMLLPQRTITITDEGLNGAMQCRLGRVASLKFGNFVLEKPLAGFLDKSAMGSATILGQNGFLGHEALQLFKVVLDYAGERVFLAPNKNYPGVFDFNMAGLYLKTLPSRHLQVREVVENSPAAQNGIEKDDLIVAINGRDVREFAGLEIYRLFIQAGAKVNLAVLRGAQQFECTVTLARLI